MRYNNEFKVIDIQEEDYCVKSVLEGLLDHCQTKIPEKIWKAEMLIRGEGYIKSIVSRNA